MSFAVFQQAHKITEYNFSFFFFSFEAVPTYTLMLVRENIFENAQSTELKTHMQEKSVIILSTYYRSVLKYFFILLKSIFQPFT